MDLSKYIFLKKYLRNGDQFSLFFDFKLQDLTGHNRKTFDDCQSLLYFLQNNSGKQIFLTLTQTPDFLEEESNLVINLKSYQEFCKKISQNGKNRTQAFLAQKLKHYADDEKEKIIADSTEEQVIERIRKFTKEQKHTFLVKLKELEAIELPLQEIENISDENFMEAFPRLLDNPNKQKIIATNYSQIQIKILEEYKLFLESNLDKNEEFIQHWIDGKIDNDGNATNASAEERKNITRSRCLIFGLEYISHKREGEISSKQFDILTRISQGKNNYVLIELKEPSGKVFDIKSRANQNEGTSLEYSLSTDVSRAIPQIAEYRSLLEKATEVEWQRIGLPKGEITKCLIVIGTKVDNPIWSEHFLNLRKNLSGAIEILTYTDLIQKIETVIKNLKDNL